MSAYLTLLTPMTDSECLLEALVDMGFARSSVDVYETPVPLEGYAGDRREQVANIVIRRRHLSAASNDIGFLATPTGYKALLSSYDQPLLGSEWLSALNKRYVTHANEKSARLAEQERLRVEEERRRLVEAQRAAIHERAKKMGYRVEEKREGETLRLVLVKRVY